MAELARCAAWDIPVRPSTGECPMCNRVARVAAADPDEPPRKPRRRREREEGGGGRNPRRGWDESPAEHLPSPAPGEGPWVAAALVGAGFFAASFLGTLLVAGVGGFPDENDLLTLPLALFFFAGLASVAFGVVHVRRKSIRGKWGTQTTGGGAVAAGFLEVVAGGLVAGVTAYGLLFKLIAWVA